jgi:hypothetical protein
MVGALGSRIVWRTTEICFEKIAKLRRRLEWLKSKAKAKAKVKAKAKAKAKAKGRQAPPPLSPRCASRG